MSVASRNPFAILNDDESSPNAALAPAPKEEPRKTEAPSRGAAKKAGPASRAGRYYSRGGGPKPTAGDDAEDATVPETRRSGGEEGGRARGRGRGRSGDRPRGGGGGASRGRPFDRHSQTGKTDSDKKVHQGWGGDEGISELKAEEAATLDAAAEGPADETPAADDDWSAPAPTDGAPAADASKDAAQPTSAVRRRFEEEEEDNTLTLDQYLAQQKEKEMAAVPKLEGVRQANEGTDASLWKDAVPINKEDEEAYFVGGKTKTAHKPRAEKKEKVYLEIEARFDRPNRGGRGGRGGDRGGDRARGAPRGSRGRGGARGRGDGNGAAQVDVDDQAAFPSLS